MKVTRALMDKIDLFNENNLRKNSKIKLTARFCQDNIYVDRNDNGIIQFFSRLVYSHSHNRWDVHIYSDRDSDFEHVSPDHQGSELIDGTLEGAINFCEFAVVM